MILPESMRDKTVAVMGLARSGLAAARALTSAGALAACWDDNAGRRAAATEAGIRVLPLEGRDWSATDLLVWSPGVPHLHPRPHAAALAARAAECPIVCDIELLWRSQPRARFIGITGTNGKSTTTALIAHILNEVGVTADAGGNIGKPAMSLRPFGPEGTYVIEMSSYQLELVPTIHFGTAVFMNVSADHLDRHGGMHGYVAAKRRIFQGQGPNDTAVVGADDAFGRHVLTDLRDGGNQRVIPISSHQAVPGGVWADNGLLIDDLDQRRLVVADLTSIPTLPGAHNWQNAAAAYAVARAASVPAEQAASALRSYPGLPHRQELVATIHGIRYVNDSKATNAESSARALVCYDNIYWIAGGMPKEGGIASLTPFFPRIRHAFLVGQASDTFASTLGRAVPHTRSGTLDQAVSDAHALAQSERRRGAVVLLSPACASFDQWPDFEARGDAFRAAATALSAEDAE